MKNGIKRSERIEDCSEYKYIGSISPLTFEAGTIPPDIYATKLFSQQLTIKEQKPPEAKFVGINAKLWEEMSVKVVTDDG